MYLLTKYIKSVRCGVVIRLSYIYIYIGCMVPKGYMNICAFVGVLIK